MNTTKFAVRAVGIALYGLWTAPASAQTVSDVLEFPRDRTLGGNRQRRARCRRGARRQALPSRARSSPTSLPCRSRPRRAGSSTGSIRSSGTVQRATTSFGPFFVERAAAPGHGSASIGLTLQDLAIHVARRPEPARRHARNNGQPVRRRGGAVRRRPSTPRHRRQHRDRPRQPRRRQPDGISAALPFPPSAQRLAREHVSRAQVFTQAEASATSVGLADIVFGPSTRCSTTTAPAWRRQWRRGCRLDGRKICWAAARWRGSYPRLDRWKARRCRRT